METNFVLEMALFLLKSDSLKFGLYTLASGKQSPYYIDLRILQSFPRYFRLTIIALRDLISREIGSDFDSLGSIPTSGLIFASALGYEMLKPLIYVRKESKMYGRRKMVEGYLRPGDKVLLVDDVATTGTSLSNTIKVIRENGAIVKDAVAIISRLEGAEEKLQKMGVRLIAIATINDLINALHDKGLLDRNSLEEIIKQKADQGGLETD
ncbi:MAG: orotate phosphoribosyltransferase [Thermoproteota archaeon]|jgi:orotate phosphoribosyltransferase|nr:orotate phosphoribosyltransferase [Thermoproteota archaeon]HZB17612.1 orotate phosphoribosyltransferase [Nitrososphaeraceae archaeon]